MQSPTNKELVDQARAQPVEDFVRAEFQHLRHPTRPFIAIHGQWRSLQVALSRTWGLMGLPGSAQQFAATCRCGDDELGRIELAQGFQNAWSPRRLPAQSRLAGTHQHFGQRG
jgi:hypothetical protein